MDSITLVCRTNDTRDDGLDHFLLGIGPDFAAFLIKARRAHKAAEKTLGSQIHCLEMFHGAGEWGSVDGYTSSGYWEQAPDETTIAEESVELQTVKVTSTGVVFAAALKNDDSNVYAETPELPWAKVEEIMTWGGVEPLSVFAGADIDMTVNCPEDEEDEDDGDEPGGEDAAGVAG